MNDPLTILCVADRPLRLDGSPFGPFTLRPCATLEEATAALQGEAPDAVLVAAPAASGEIAAWPSLSQAVLDAAVVVVADPLEVGQAVDLLRAGVQDVLPATADADALGRALRLAVERKRLEGAARKALATDLATGLPNHLQLIEHMTHLVALRAREPAPMALIVLRVDGLAQAASALGAEAANVLKRKVAVRLRAGLRASDVVASLGGDTFAVLLAWIDAADDSDRVARKLAASLAQPFSITGRRRSLAVSVGLARFPEHGDQAESLLRRALGQAASLPPTGTVGGPAPADRGPASANDEG